MTLPAMKKAKQDRPRGILKNSSTPKTGHAGRKDRRGRSGEVQPGGGSEVSRKERKGQPWTSPRKLTAPWRPTGRSVFRLSLTRPDPQPQTTHRITFKSLGVVGPDCDLHSYVEKDFICVRQNVEDYLEKRMKGEGEDLRCRAGGQVEEQQQLLHTLTARLPPIQDNQHRTSTQYDLKEPQDTHVKEDSPTVFPTLPSSPETTPHTPLANSPETRSTRESPRSGHTELTAGFVTEEEDKHGRQRARVTVANISSNPAETFGHLRGQLPKEQYLSQGTTDRPKRNNDPADSSRGLPMDQYHVEVSKRRTRDRYPVGAFHNRPRDLNPKETSKRCSKDQHPSPVSNDRPKDRSLRVEKKPLSWRAEKSKKKQELERGFDVIRTVHQHYPDSKPQDRSGLTTSVHWIPLSWGLLSTPASRKEHDRFLSPSRGQAGMTPENRCRPGEVPLNGKPPSPTFQPRAPGGITEGRPVFWKPLVSRFGHDPFEVLSERTEESVEGRNTISHVLNVVLSRALTSREGRWCGRQWINLGPQPLPLWLAMAPSPPPPPPPPPPSAPMDTGKYASDDDGEQDDEAEEADDDGNQLDTHNPTVSKCPSGGVLGPSVQRDSDQRETPTQLPSEDSMSVSGTLKQDSHLPTNTLIGLLPKHSRAGTIDHAEYAERSKCHAECAERSKCQTDSTADRPEVQEKAATSPTKSKQASVPSLCLGPRMTTAESTFHTAGEQGDSILQAPWSCRRAAHCDLLGPRLCPDCEAARHRQQFTSRQELLYPHINVFPRHMVASQRLQTSMLPRMNPSGASSRWPYVSFSRLNNVVTELDLCKRIVEKKSV